MPCQFCLSWSTIAWPCSPLSHNHAVSHRSCCFYLRFPWADKRSGVQPVLSNRAPLKTQRVLCQADLALVSHAHFACTCICFACTLVQLHKCCNLLQYQINSLQTSYSSPHLRSVECCYLGDTMFSRCAGEDPLLTSTIRYR